MDSPVPAPWQYTALGDPTHPPLIFLHGFLGCGADFRPLAEPLSRRFYCLLPDLPGHGGTPLPERPLSFAMLHRQFHLLLDSLGIERFTLAGYSMGGRLALYFAVQMAGRVQALVVESANPGLRAPAERAARLQADQQRARRMLQIGMEAFLQEWYDMPLFASLHRNPQALRAMRAARAAGNAPPQAARVIVELSPARQPSLWEALPSLSMPALFLAGALDPKYAALVRRMAARLRRGQALVIPEAGHNIHFEQPEAWLRAVRDFLEHWAGG